MARQGRGLARTGTHTGSPKEEFCAQKFYPKRGGAEGLLASQNGVFRGAALGSERVRAALGSDGEFALACATTVGSQMAECLVLWFCVSLLCDRHRPSSVHPSLEVLEVDILWPRWVARIGVTRATEACFLTADRQCTEYPCSSGNFLYIVNDRRVSPNIAQYRAISRNIAQYRAISRNIAQYRAPSPRRR